MCDRLAKISAELSNEIAYLEKQRLSEASLTKITYRVAECQNEQLQVESKLRSLAEELKQIDFNITSSP